MSKSFRRFARLLAALIIVVVLTGMYFFKWHAQPIVLMNEETGLTILGYDERQKKWLINEYPQRELGVDGPYIFYRPGGTAEVVSVGGDTAALGVVRERRRVSPGDTFACTVDNASLTRFSFRIQDSLRLQPAIHAAPRKLLALSDIEGNFGTFVSLLAGNGVVDSVRDGDLHWTYGDGHLVLLGDFMDRGTNVTQCLWLIYKLEDEARAAGGAVHFILGNHEQLNLQGSMKYAEPKYHELRRRLGIPYTALYGPDTELGRWLRTKNVAEQIGDAVFVHGGVSPAAARLRYPLEKINALCRAHLDTKEAQIREADARLLLGPDGILWYRGLVDEYRDAAKLDMTRVDSVLTALGIARLVVGHTLVDAVSADYGGKVVRLDVKHAERAPQALLMEGGRLYRVDAAGTRAPL